jgi:hypothetical protein
MAKCSRCGKRFSVSDTKSEYEDEFGNDIDSDYYEFSYGNEVCASCAISDTYSNMNLGRAIDMMNGEEYYDDDFVKRYL